MRQPDGRYRQSIPAVTRFTTPIGLRRRDCYRGGLRCLVSRLHLASLSLASHWLSPRRGANHTGVLLAPSSNPSARMQVGRLDMAPSAIRLALAHAASPPLPRLDLSPPFSYSSCCSSSFDAQLFSCSFVDCGEPWKRRQSTPPNSSNLRIQPPRCYRGLAQSGRANLESIVSGRRVDPYQNLVDFLIT